MDRARLAVLTCLDYSSGYFNVLSHIADQDLDAVVHLGDFIYEYNKYPEYPKDITFRPIEFRKVPLNNKGETPFYMAETLADYRAVYRTYRTDKHLRRALAAHAWIIVWDDHEIADNSFHGYERKGEGIGYTQTLQTPSLSLKRTNRLILRILN